MPTSDLMTTREVAARLDTSIRNVSRLVEVGDLTPAQRLPLARRGVFLFRREDVETLAESRTKAKPV